MKRGRFCSLLALMCAIPPCWAVAGSPEPDPLPDPGTIRERQLNAGEAHRYRPLRSQGETLWLTVTQDGIDVVVSIVGGDGKARLTVDSPSASWGEEWLYLESSAFGDQDFTVEIRAIAPHGAAGKYRLRAVSRFPAESGDRLRAAEKAVTTAGQLYHQGTEEAHRQALEAYSEALVNWRALGRDGEAARTLFYLAMLHRQLDEPRQAQKLLRQTLAAWQRLGERQGEAQTLMEMASTARMLGANEPAEEAYERALEGWRDLGDLQGQARTLNYLGLMRSRTDPGHALESYQEALALFRQIGNVREEGVALNNLGGLHDLQGEPHLALARFREALDIHQRLGDLRQQATVWNNIASVHRRTGKLQRAIEGYRASLTVRRELGDRRGQGRALNNLGLTWLSLGEAARARDLLGGALLLRRASEDRRGESITLHNLGLVHAELGAWDQAEDFWIRALDLRRALGDRNGEAATLVAMGESATELDRASLARQYLEEALVILEEIGNPWRQAKAWRALGQALTVVGEPDEALTVLARSLRIFRALDDEIGQGDTLLALARAERTVGQRLDRLASAYAHALAALDLLETVRADIDSLDFRASFFSQHAKAFEFAVDLAMELQRRDPAAGWAARALEISERARARSFLDRLEESGSGPRRGLDTTLLARQHELLDRLNAKVEHRHRLLGRHGPSPASERLAVEAREVLARLSGVETELRRQNPLWHGMVAPRPLTARAIQALLDPQTTLLQYALGEERSFLWAVTARELASFELPGRAELEAVVREVCDSLRIYDPRAQQKDARIAARLSEVLLGPAAERLEDQRLIIVADGALHYLPFAALPDPVEIAEPLVVRHELVSLPSASALGIQRQILADRSMAAKAVAILADPVFGLPDPRLPRFDKPRSGKVGQPATLASRDAAYRGVGAGELRLQRLGWSRWEAEKIAAHAGEEQAFVALGFDAELDVVRGGRLRGYRVIHFASHGFVEDEHPELSALVLSLYDDQGRPREGLLRLPEIYQLELDAELVVLSGCRTALGREIRGEGMIGLTRGFFAAGARRLVASLWRVRDRSTAELMDRFYHHLFSDDEKVRPAAALRAAQLELLREPKFSDPYHWAAFAIYGDWR